MTDVAEVYTYDIGDRVKIEAMFRDDDGNPADPDTIVLGLRQPDGTRVVHDYSDPGQSPLVREEAGHYSYVMTAAQTGKHSFRWLATGTGAGADEGYFWVRLSRPTLTTQGG